MRAELIPISGVNGQMPVSGYTKQFDFTTGQWKIGPNISTDYHLHECKSIGSEKIDNIKNGIWDDFEQFLQGIGSVPSLNNYHLHFNPAAFGGDPLRAKKAMQGLFNQKSGEIFQQMFNNVSLRNSLFGSLDEVEAARLFLQKVNPTDGTTLANNSFFNFVQ